MTAARRFVVQFACVIAVPFLYFVSSGPVLRYFLDHSKPYPGSTFAIVVQRPPDHQRWASERFYQAIRSFYSPLVRVATDVGFKQPAFAYLKLWKVMPLEVSHRRYLFVRI